MDYIMPIEYIVINLILAAAIGSTTVYIAYQQYNINRARLNYETYDRRLKIYQSTRELFDLVGQHGTVRYEDMRKFYSDTQEADFLIGTECRKYITKLYKEGVKLAHLNKKMYLDNGQPNPKLPIGEERNAVADSHDQLLTWFVSEEEKLKRRFSPYLRLE